MTPSADGLRIWQLRRGPEGTMRVRQLGVDHVVVREDDDTISVYDRDGFAARFPEVVERSSLERLEARREQLP